MAGKCITYSLQAIILALVAAGFTFSFRTLKTCELANNGSRNIPIKRVPSFGLYTFYNSTISDCQEYPDGFDRDAKFSASFWSANLAFLFSGVAIIALLSQFLFPCCAGGGCGRLKKCGLNLHFTFTSILQALTFLFLTNDSLCGGWGGCSLGEGAWNLYAAQGAYFLAGVIACFAPLPTEPLFRYNCCDQGKKTCCNRCKKDKNGKRGDDGKEDKEKKKSAKLDESKKSAKLDESPSSHTHDSVEDSSKDDEQETGDEEAPAERAKEDQKKAEEQERKREPSVYAKEDEKEEEPEKKRRSQVAQTQTSWQQYDGEEDETFTDEEAPFSVTTRDSVAPFSVTTRGSAEEETRGSAEEEEEDEKEKEEEKKEQGSDEAPDDNMPLAKERQALKDSIKYVNDSIKYQTQGDGMCGGVLNFCE